MPQQLLAETSAEILPLPPVRETYYAQPRRAVQPPPAQKRDYLAYMLPTTLVVPMFAYGTKLELALTVAMILGWGTYAAIRWARDTKAHERSTPLENRAH